MFFDDKVYAANAHGKKLFLLPKMANRHGLITGATGTGKTVISALDYKAFRKKKPGKPMNITWRLDAPIPAKYLKKTNKLVVG